MGETTPRASVVMAARNEADDIGRAIRSILDQGHDDVEIIVVDDGSTDDTAAVAASFAGVRVVPNSADGYVGALNLGLELARSDIIIRIDADDWHLPGSVDALAGALEADPGAVLVAGSARVEDAGGNLLDLHSAMPTADHMRVVAMVTCPVEHTACAFRRGAIMALGGYRTEGDVHAGEDLDLWIRVFESGGTVIGLTEQIAVHTITPSTMSTVSATDADSRSRRLRAAFRARRGPELCTFGSIRRLGREVVRRGDDPTGRVAEFSWTLVRLVLLSLDDRAFRRAIVVAAATISVGPYRVAAGVLRKHRARAARRGARGLPPRSPVVGSVLGQ